jgi:hypothetical protein
MGMKPSQEVTMRNKLIPGIAAAAALLVATPIWAHGGGHGHGHGHWKHGHGHHHHAHAHYYQPSYVVRERWYPAPVYAAPVYTAPVYAAPAPGVQVVLPNIFIPLR